MKQPKQLTSTGLIPNNNMSGLGTMTNHLSNNNMLGLGSVSNQTPMGLGQLPSSHFKQPQTGKYSPSPSAVPTPQLPTWAPQGSPLSGMATGMGSSASFPVPAPGQLPFTATAFADEQPPSTTSSILYTPGFLRTQIGRSVRVEFLIGTNQLVDRFGVLAGVGASYILIAEAETDDILLCDIYSIKFVRFYF